MGLETVLILGLAAFQADQAIKQGDAEADAVIEQTNLENKERLKRTRALAGSQKVSFLNSGLTLEGSPMSVIQNTFDTGIEDIELASRNAERTAKNIQSSARTKAISTLVQAGASAGMGSFGGNSQGGSAFSGDGFFGSQGTVSRTIEFGNPNVQGPIQGFGGSGGFDIGGGLRKGTYNG